MRLHLQSSCACGGVDVEISFGEDGREVSQVKVSVSVIVRLVCAQLLAVGDFDLPLLILTNADAVVVVGFLFLYFMSNSLIRTGALMSS